MSSKQAVLQLPFTSKPLFFRPPQPITMIVHGSERDSSVMNMLVEAGGAYEAETMSLLGKLISPNFVCLDIGANIGLISLAMSVLAKRGVVHAFEALPQNYQYLLQNMRANKIKNVKAHNLAVYDRNGTLSFDFVEEFAAGSFISETGVHDHRSKRTDVQCVRLDDWVAGEKLNRIDLIKMDIEGAELRAIEGALRTLSGFKPLLIIECNSHALNLLQGVNPTHFLEKLAGIFPYVYLIHADGRLIQVTHQAQFDEETRWQEQNIVQNMLCSFKPITLS